jgi:hypothetical protein
MQRFELGAGTFIAPTPGGAYMATQVPDDDPARRLLRALLAADESPALTADALCRWSGLAREDSALELAWHLQSQALVQAVATPLTAPAATLEEMLPGLLAPLSHPGKALLADAQGFYLATTGFPHETAEELSALSADIASLHERHGRMLRHNLGLDNSSWAIIDASGNSQLGVWPLYVGRQRFALVAAGTPQFNQQAFVDLVWVLTRRYAQVTESVPTGTRGV